MAESIGLIIGEYTIPSDLPVIYITDSNNTRPLKKYTKPLFDVYFNTEDTPHQSFGAHTFCKKCSLIVFNDRVTHATICPRAVTSMHHGKLLDILV
jgi:hypothetical protein